MTQLESTISNLTPATIARLTGTAVVAADDSTAVTVKATLAQIRTMMFAGGTGYTATDPLLVGGEIGSNAAALATSATTPFLWVPSTAGTPTGVPAASAGGAVPLVVDTTNSKLYARVAGTWSGVTLGAAAAANGFKYITTLTASTSASLSYTAFDATTYSTYCIVMEDLAGNTAGNNFALQGSVDAGANYGALWSYTMASFTGATLTQASGTASTDLTLAMIASSAASRGICGTLYLSFGSAAGERSQVYGQTTYNTNTPTRQVALLGGFYDSASAVNALKWSGVGNIVSGTIHIYGLQKA